jgi:hypothetical protein
MSFLEPQVAKAVNEVLNRMNITEQVKQAASESAKAQVTAIAKEIEKALPNVIEQKITAMVQQAQEQPAEQPQPLAGGQANIAQIAQLWQLLKGNSTGSLEQVNKTMEMASNLANIFMKPYIEGQQAARQELNETIKLVTGIQKLSPDVRDKMFGETK